MTKQLALPVTALLLSMTCLGSSIKDKLVKPQQPSPLEQYVTDAEGRVSTDPTAVTTGSTWSNYSTMTDLTRDPRASRIDDVVTIVVAESASAVSTGATQTARKSSATAAVTGFPGIKSAAASTLLSNLAKMSSDTELNGQGTTSRTTTLNTELTARVVHVLPNGFLVIEGTKNVQVNSEWQTVSVRGVVRPADLTADNTIPTGRIAQLEVKLDGKGVVNDAIRRPNILYRILLGLLPF
jgi:flagellar L-ring protein precursor FlgH